MSFTNPLNLRDKGSRHWAGWGGGRKPQYLQIRVIRIEIALTLHIRDCGEYFSAYQCNIYDDTAGTEQSLRDEKLSNNNSNVVPELT